MRGCVNLSSIKGGTDLFGFPFLFTDRKAVKHGGNLYKFRILTKGG